MAKDTLAQGGKSANFGSMSHISAEKWNAIFNDIIIVDKKEIKKK